MLRSYTDRNISRLLVEFILRWLGYYSLRYVCWPLSGNVLIGTFNLSFMEKIPLQFKSWWACLGGSDITVRELWDLGYLARSASSLLTCHQKFIFIFQIQWRWNWEPRVRWLCACVKRSAVNRLQYLIASQGMIWHCAACSATTVWFGCDTMACALQVTWREWKFWPWKVLTGSSSSLPRVRLCFPATVWGLCRREKLA